MHSAPRFSWTAAIVENPHQQWADFNTQLPAADIMAFIPGTKHGTREVFEDKVLLKGCRGHRCYGSHDGLLACLKMMLKMHVSMCVKMVALLISMAIIPKLWHASTPIPTVSASLVWRFIENNQDKLKVATMGGIAPSTETISTGQYPVSRPLFFYVKKAHLGVIPGLKEFASFFIADEIAGPDGPLSAYGLVADPDLATTQAAVSNETAMGSK